jgi:mannosyltransferase
MDDVDVAAPEASNGATAAPAPRGRRAVDAAALAGRLYWLWPALLTLIYGLWGIRTPSLWADELATWGAVRMSWRSLYQMLGSVDAVVGPYFTIIKIWTDIVGTSTTALRLPSVGAMVVAAALISLLGARLASGGAARWTGLLAGLAFAVMPTTSRYAQEARPYAFAMLFAILATLLLVRLMERPSPAAAAWYALAVIGLGAFHLVALLLLIGHAALAWRRARVYWAIAAGVGVLPLLPLLWLGHRQSAQISWIKPAKWLTLLSTWDVVFTAPVVAGFVIVLAVLAFSRRWQSLLLITWALVPVAVLFVLARLTPVYWPRYLLFTMPAWLLLAALTLARRSRLQAVLLVLALALVGHPMQFEIRASDGHSHGDRQAAGIIAANEAPGDGIAYKLTEQPEPWEGRDLVARYVPTAHQPRDVFAVTPQRTDGHLLATECTDLAICLDRANPTRMWIVRFGTQPDPLSGIGEPKSDLLRARYRLARLWLVKGLTIGLFVRG